ncbi:MAG: hypothetical protein HW403_204 [Dehalococcoidia bacterium]|nr:hypothetical protein [Dehalococcoidia bacterium]
MMERELTRRRFQRIVEGEDEEIDLASACLLIAQEEYTDINPGQYLDRLEEMAATIEGRLGKRRRPEDVIYTISSYLFQEQGFRGNDKDYYDPRNSFLNDVLDRKLGIPITLSLVYMEVAQRLGFSVLGVGLPGHFIVKHPTSERDLFIDPFQGGGIITEEECKRLVEVVYRGSLVFRRDFLRRLSKRAILGRILSNLKRIYQGKGDHVRALAVVERILLLNPDAPTEIRDRGLLSLRLHAYANSWRDLNTYIDLVPNGEDVVRMKEMLAALERMRMN